MRRAWWPLERAVVLALWITSIVVLPVSVLGLCVVWRSKPVRVRLKTTLAKLWSIEIEIDAQDKPGELHGEPTGNGRDLTWNTLSGRPGLRRAQRRGTLKTRECPLQVSADPGWVRR
jgi:hypothetical protein